MSKKNSDMEQEEAFKMSVYTKAELIEAAESIFGVKGEVVAAIMRIENKEEMTKQDMEKAIEKFMSKEVE